MFERILGGDKGVAEEGLPEDEIGVVGETNAEVVDLAAAREAVEEEGGGVEDPDFSAEEMEAAEKEHREAA